MKEYKKIFESEESESMADKLLAAFRAGPEKTREFLDSKEGMSEEVRSLLKQPHLDGIESDDKVSISDAPGFPVKDLIPTQRFIDLMQSVSFPLSQAKSLSDSIASKKGFGTIIISKSSEGILIIDGHHRWSGIFGIAPDGKIDAKMVSWPGVNAKEKLAAAQLSIAAWKGAGKPLPSKGGEPAFNILGKSAAEIVKLILDNVGKPEVVDPKVKDFGGLLNDKMIEDVLADPDAIFEWAGIEEGEKSPEAIRKAIAERVGQNLSQMNNYVDGAPPREAMPQFDPDIEGPKFSELEGSLKSGDINLAPPFEKDSVVAKKARKAIQTFESFYSEWKSKRR